MRRRPVGAVAIAAASFVYALTAGYVIGRSGFQIAGAFWPSLIAVPALIALAAARFMPLLFAVCVALALCMEYLGYTLGYREPDYLTPLSGAVASAIVNAPPVILLAVVTNILARVVRSGSTRN